MSSEKKLDFRDTNWENLGGVRIVVAAFGILCGLTGIIAGIFEILQGNTSTNGFIISTIGADYSMANDFTYFAITIIPNFMITGILAVVVSTLVTLWSVRFVQVKNGVIVLLGLTAIQTLVGGGWIIDLALMTCIVATRIDKPLNWWRKHFHPTVRVWLSSLFPLGVFVYAIISSAMLILTVFGVNNQTLIDILTPLATAMFLPMLLMIFGGIAHEIQRVSSLHNDTSMI